MLNLIKAVPGIIYGNVREGSIKLLSGYKAIIYKNLYAHIKPERRIVV